MNGGTWLSIAILGGLLVASGAVGIWVWREMADVAIGTHGYVALALGAGFSIALGVALMSLVWRSHKQDYDDDAGRD